VVVTGGVGEELLDGVKLRLELKGSGNGRRRSAPVRFSWWSEEQMMTRGEQRRWWQKGQNLGAACAFYSRVRRWMLVAWRWNCGWETVAMPQFGQGGRAARSA
jgi:hypothetical protein